MIEDPKSDDLPTLATPAPFSGTVLLPAGVGSTPHAIGDFRIVGKLGEGGMGNVYEAEQRTPQRRVALKVVRGGQIGTAVAALGADHPEVATFRENLGTVYFQTGRMDLTASNLELVLASRRKALGDDSGPVARTLANMATVYMRSGNLERAEPTFREAVERLSRNLGPDHPDVGTTMASFGEVLRKNQKYAESETTLRRALTVLQKTRGEKDQFTRGVRENLGKLYTDWGKPAQAAEYLAKPGKEE